MKEFKGHTGVVGIVGFSADGEQVVTGSTTGEDGTLRVWNAKTAKEIRKIDVGKGAAPAELRRAFGPAAGR